MNKPELIENLSLKVKPSLVSKADLIVNEIIELFSYSLINGKKIEIRGFGSFNIKKYLSKNKHNPRNMSSVEDKEKRKIYFRCSKNLFNRLNEVKNEIRN